MIFKVVISIYMPIVIYLALLLKCILQNTDFLNFQTNTLPYLFKISGHVTKKCEAIYNIAIAFS